MFSCFLLLPNLTLNGYTGSCGRLIFAVSAGDWISSLNQRLLTISVSVTISEYDTIHIIGNGCGHSPGLGTLRS